MRSMSPIRRVKTSRDLITSHRSRWTTTGLLLAGLSLAMIFGSRLAPVSADNIFPQTYRYTDLGTLGTPNSSCDGSYAVVINNSGQAAGAYYTNNCMQHAFLWTDNNNNGRSDPGEMIDLGTLANNDVQSQSFATGINNNGKVVGYSYSSTGDTFFRAFLYDGAQMTDIGTLRKDNAGIAVALGINDFGQILVVASVEGQPSQFPGLLHYGILGNGQKIDLGVECGLVDHFPDNSNTSYYNMVGGINKFGHVVGSLQNEDAQDGCGPKAFFYDGQVHEISHDCSFFANGNRPTGINDSDQVVLLEHTSPNVEAAFIYKNGIKTPISRVGPINNSGQIVYGTNGGHIISGGTDYVLPHLTTPNFQFIGLSLAIGLNDVGQIVGAGYSNHAMVLTPLAQTNSIQLGSATFSVGEGGGVATINAVRTGDTSYPATVSYMTTNGSGKEGTDYEAASGTLNFAAGEAAKTFQVLIVDNGFADGPRTVNLTLNNASGAALGTPGSAVLTIADNDPASVSNPLDSPSSFVQLHYYDFLARFPDQSGWDFWTNQITTCGSNAQCIEAVRINVSAAFYVSIEFQNTGYLVERIYKAAYGDADGTSTFNGAHALKVPIVRLNEFLPDTREIGTGVVVGQTGWEAALENNKRAFAQEFVQRARFANAFPTTMTPAQFVDRLFSNIGLTPSSIDRSNVIGEFGSAADTTDVAARARALRDVSENATFTSNEFNRGFVLMQYFGYLRRNPNDPPDTDYTGYDFWLTKLNQFNGNYINAEMVKAFIAATEYRHRFGP